jgi:Ca-activated chloride channel family protein
VGIVTFAGSSFYYLPMTTDYEAAQIFLTSIDTKMISTQGTQLSVAINTAINIFPKENDKFKVLVLVTDGEDHQGEAVSLTKKSAKSGIVVHTVGVGSEAGSLIPVKDELGNRIDYKKDREGKLVTSSINTKVLEDIAKAGNGITVRLDNRKGNYRELVEALDQMEKKTISTHEFSEFEDRYQIFANIGIIFLIGAFLLRTKPRNNNNKVNI